MRRYSLHLSSRFHVDIPHFIRDTKAVLHFATRDGHAMRRPNHLCQMPPVVQTCITHLQALSHNSLIQMDMPLRKMKIVQSCVGYVLSSIHLVSFSDVLPVPHSTTRFPQHCTN